VRLRSPEPTAKVVIRHNHLSAPEDVDLLVEAVRLNLDIADQPSLQRYRTGELQYPASRSEEDIRSFLARCAQGFWHPTSTCPLGEVLDPELRVHGVQSLRVCDASAMPAIVGANPNASIIAMAEKCSDMMRGLEPAGAAGAAASQPAR
jgi:choline dehydrogenase-like flavoprotein